MIPDTKFTKIDLLNVIIIDPVKRQDLRFRLLSRLWRDSGGDRGGPSLNFLSCFHVGS